MNSRNASTAKASNYGTWDTAPAEFIRSFSGLGSGWVEKRPLGARELPSVILVGVQLFPYRDLIWSLVFLPWTCLGAHFPSSKRDPYSEFVEGGPMGKAWQQWNVIEVNNI